MKLLGNAKLVTVATVSIVSLLTIAIFKRDREPRSISVAAFVGQVFPSPSRAVRDVLALTDLGSRETGTPKNEKALAYLDLEYQKAGYETEVQAFTYSKFDKYNYSLFYEWRSPRGMNRKHQQSKY